MRKIIQVVVIHVNKYNHFGVLCDDGTLWVRERTKKMEAWNVKATDPPQPDWTWNEIDTSQISKPTTAAAAGKAKKVKAKKKVS